MHRNRGGSEASAGRTPSKRTSSREIPARKSEPALASQTPRAKSAGEARLRRSVVRHVLRLRRCPQECGFCRVARRLDSRCFPGTRSSLEATKWASKSRAPLSETSANVFGGQGVPSPITPAKLRDRRSSVVAPGSLFTDFSAILPSVVESSVPSPSDSTRPPSLRERALARVSGGENSAQPRPLAYLAADGSLGEQPLERRRPSLSNSPALAASARTSGIVLIGPDGALDSFQPALEDAIGSAVSVPEESPATLSRMAVGLAWSTPPPSEGKPESSSALATPFRSELEEELAKLKDEDDMLESLRGEIHAALPAR
jgi:hypothetical protein